MIAMAARQNSDGVEVDVTSPGGGTRTVAGSSSEEADGIGSVCAGQWA